MVGKKKVKTVVASDVGPNGPVIGADNTLNRLSLVKKMIIAAVALVVIALAYIGITMLFSNPFPDDIKLASSEALGAQITLLDPADQKRIIDSTPRTTEQQHAKALAYAALGQSKAAISEYKKLTADDDAKYYVFADYAMIQSNSGDPKSAVKTMETAMSKLKNDSQLKDMQKKEINSALAGKLDGFKDQARQN